MTRRQPKVIAADSHRNGVGGVGFHVAIVADRVDGVYRRMLVIDFDTDPDDRTYRGCTAVLDLDQANAGNVYMHPTDLPGTGGNAWRGDRLGDAYRNIVQGFIDARYDRIGMDADADALTGKEAP